MFLLLMSIEYETLGDLPGDECTFKCQVGSLQTSQKCYAHDGVVPTGSASEDLWPKPRK